MEFEWAPAKAAANLRKHQVSFDEAVTVFADSLSMTASDPDHSGEEMRYITVGRSIRDRLIMVAYADRRGTIRIISARKLTRSERSAYEEVSQ